MAQSQAWGDFHVRKTLRTGQRVFEFDVELQLSSPRVVLAGPSGIGKTMLLEAIAGLIRPDGGHIRIGRQMLFDSARGLNLKPQQRRVGLLFQDYALLPHLTVLGNVGFGLRRGIWGRLSRDQQALALQWLERFGLAETAAQYPYTLSGGQRQRLALARLAILQPQVLLLDEPFSALDPPLRRAMREQVLNLQQTLDIPLLLVSHDEEDRRAMQAEVVELGLVGNRTVRMDEAVRPAGPGPLAAQGVADVKEQAGSPPDGPDSR